MEHGGMGGVGVGTEDTAGYQHLDGRALGVHDADLAAAGLGAQHDVLGHIEGVLHIPGGMVLGHVQAGEVVLVVLDLGAFVDFKAHTGENVDDLVLDQGDGMQAAGGVALAGQGDVHRLGLVAGFQFGSLDLGGQGLIHALCPDLAFVDELAGGGTVFLGHLPQALGQAGDGPVLAEVFLPEGGKFLFVVHGVTVSFQLRAQCVDLFLHGSHLSFAAVAGRSK